MNKNIKDMTIKSALATALIGIVLIIVHALGYYQGQYNEYILYALISITALQGVISMRAIYSTEEYEEKLIKIENKINENEKGIETLAEKIIPIYEKYSIEKEKEEKERELKELKVYEVLKEEDGGIKNE